VVPGVVAVLDAIRGEQLPIEKEPRRNEGKGERRWERKVKKIRR